MSLTGISIYFTLLCFSASYHCVSFLKMFPSRTLETTYDPVVFDLQHVLMSKQPTCVHSLHWYLMQLTCVLKVRTHSKVSVCCDVPRGQTFCIQLILRFIPIVHKMDAEKASIYCWFNNPQKKQSQKSNRKKAHKCFPQISKHKVYEGKLWPAPRGRVLNAWPYKKWLAAEMGLCDFKIRLGEMWSIYCWWDKSSSQIHIGAARNNFSYPHITVTKPSRKTSITPSSAPSFLTWVSAKNL